MRLAGIGFRNLSYTTPGQRGGVWDGRCGLAVASLWHNAVTGENLDGWKLRADAMELVNSGAQQTDMMRLYRDWFGLLNRGIVLTPVGASSINRSRADATSRASMKSRAVEGWNAIGLNDERDMARLGNMQRVAEQTETGDVRGGIHSDFHHAFG